MKKNKIKTYLIPYIIKIRKKSRKIPELSGTRTKNLINRKIKEIRDFFFFFMYLLYFFQTGNTDFGFREKIIRVRSRVHDRIYRSNFFTEINDSEKIK